MSGGIVHPLNGFSMISKFHFFTMALGLLFILAPASFAEYGVLGQNLHHVDARASHEEAASSESRVDLEEHILARSGIVFHIEIRKTDVSDAFKEILYFCVKCVVAS